MGERAFRFGVVCGGASDREQWTKLVKRIEDLGFDTLLVPDAAGSVAPFPALSMAAGVTTRLRLGTFVLAAPLRSAGAMAWETASLDRLSDGRFELGLGAGRPGAEYDAQLLGVPFGTPGQRIADLAEKITAIRELFTKAGEQAPGQMAPHYVKPVQEPGPQLMIAGAGPKLLRLAAAEADIIAVAGATEHDLGERVDLVRSAAGDRFDDIELSTNLFAVGDAELPEWITKFFNVDPAKAVNNKAIAVLNGGPAEMAEVLLRRREQFGISYVTVNQFALEAFIPVFELLRGR